MPGSSQLIHPDITAEMKAKINTIISSYSNTDGVIIPALRKCQDVVGYLPIELIDYISLGLNMPRSEVLGVATFYSLFSLVPKGRHTIKACLGTACYVKGIKEVMTRIENEFNLEDGKTTEDRRFSLEAVRCVGACGLAPVVMINQDTHGSVTSGKISVILEKYE